MKCEEFLAEAQAYALGALTPEERSACDAHLAETRAHRGCEEALARAVDTVGALGAALPALVPPAEVWREIEARLDAPRAATVTPLVPSPVSAVRSPARARRRSLAWGVALAATLAAGFLSWDRARLSTELRSARDARVVVDLLSLPGTQVVALGPPPAASGAAPSPASPLQARAVYHSGRRTAVVVFQGTPADADHDYELWVIRGQEKVAAGVLRIGEEGEGHAVVGPDLLATAPDAFAVTLEPAGGGPVPRGSLVLVGALAQR